MYLTILDLVAIMIALGVSVTLVITTAIQNARITRYGTEMKVSRDYWRNAYVATSKEFDLLNDSAIWNQA